MSTMTIVAVAASIFALAVGGITIIGDGYHFDLRGKRDRRGRKDRSGGRRAADLHA